jgi:hypothetical protein
VTRRIAIILCTAMLLGACEEGVEPGMTQAPIRVSHSVARSHLDAIRRAAADEGITNFLAIALLAEEETGLDHCGRWACYGPSHHDCGGGPVISGGGDGPSSANQGGIGMNQIDQGSKSHTIN